jgi:hypothetical protein
MDDTLTVGATKYEEKLVAGYRDDGLTVQFIYKLGNHFPSIPLLLSWAEWERFVAWVEWQRRENDLNKEKPS